MLRKLLVAAAALLSIASFGAHAQTSSPSASSPTASGAAAPSGAAGTSASFLSRQTSDQMLASDMIDQSVYGPDGRSIGEISDFVLDRMGNVVGVVIGVGAAIGAGDKDVAVPFNLLQIVRHGTNEERITLSATRNDLMNAPAFARLPPATTGSGSTPGAGSSAPPGGATPR